MHLQTGYTIAMKLQVKTILSVAALVAWCVFIFYMSAKPAAESDEISLGFIGHFIAFIVPGYDQMSVAQQLEWQLLLNHPVRKLAHFSEFALLGMFALNALHQALRKPASAPRLAACAWIFATLYATSDEFHQIFVPGRTGMITDVCIDASGALAGVLILWTLHRFLIEKPRKNK